MDYKEKYEQGLECLEEILNSGQEKIKMTLLKERLLPFFPELESEDERMKKKCINFLNLHKRYCASSAEIDDCIAWLKKQKATDKEIIFRALPGTDIIAAAKQALEKIEIGKEVILSFNDIYIPVNGKTVAEICNEYFSWTEKQGEKKVPSVDFKAKDCYVSKVDGNIHDMTYDAVDKVEPKNMEDETEIPFDANDSELTEVTYYIPKGFHAEIDDDKVVIKIGENKPIMNVPTREVILAIWDLGNEWKELTNGSISTKYGTTLDYIQKHWNESEYYLREKQDEQNKNNSENYCEDCINRKGCINCENGNLKETISLDSCEKQDEQDFSHNVDDEIRNELYDFIYITTFQPKDLKKKERFLDWIEKQGQKSTWNEEDERLRNSCIEHIEEELEEIGKDKFGHSEIISDLKESCRERINWLKSLKKDWLEKQGEQKLKEEIKTTAYDTSDSDVIEYVYILDYSTGRVIVAKHDIKESIEDLFKKLGLKESQCHYMVSSDVLSIEYINF